jgi:uncharacterized protein (TIGR02145 family)
MKIRQTNLILLALFCVVACEQKKGIFTDSRDGKIYKITKIGEQVWMAENLNYETEGSKCYDNKPENCIKYGRLYDWETAMKACPKGWHLPNNAEWDKLYRYVDGTSGTESPYESPTAGKYLKMRKGWKEDDEGKSGNGKDAFGFSALPGGFGVKDDFGSGHYNGYWWSSSEFDSSDAWDGYIYTRDIAYDSQDASWNGLDKIYSFNIRCLQD